jgi:hypothetical protein
MGLQVTNSTISGNHSTGPGGGALISPYGSYNSGPPPTHTHSGPVTIQSSTIASNAASAGGGVYDQARSISGEPPPVSTLSSTILAGNSPAELGANADSSGFAAGNSLIQTSVSGIPFTETPAGSNVIGADPQLGPLEDNGGPTETMLPGAGSPAIDAGVANGLSTDQRGAGFGRTADDPNVANHAGSDGTDIGSVEAPLNAQPGGPSGTPVPHRKKCKKKKSKHGHKTARAAKKCKKHKKKK